MVFRLSSYTSLNTHEETMVRINNADDELVKQFCNECETIENGSDESATYHTARLDLFL